ncbi:response regulator [Pseudomonas sp. MDMC_285]|nr:response regulator [Pseudomonas sp. MDMC_285]
MGASGKVRVLCIEDERMLLDDLRDELCAAGYEVSTAESAHQAFKLLGEFTPDLILCDVMLGGMTQLMAMRFCGTFEISVQICWLHRSSSSRH